MNTNCHLFLVYPIVTTVSITFPPYMPLTSPDISENSALYGNIGCRISSVRQAPIDVIGAFNGRGCSTQYGGSAGRCKLEV